MRPHFTFNQRALIAFHTEGFSLHLGVYREVEPDSLYREAKDGSLYYDEINHWLWGHAIEPYDLCLDYYGGGPFFLLVKPR